jgi:plasmid stabilization system protein ParE
VKVLFSHSALRDLTRLRDFIAEKDPTAAERISKRLRVAIERLSAAPRIGRPLEDFRGEVRELITGSYVVHYRISGELVYIVRVWHGREIRA